MKYKKIMTVLLGFTLLLCIGMVLAGIFPNPFVMNGNNDVNIIYGANAASSDAVGANSIGSNLIIAWDSQQPEVIVDDNDGYVYISGLGISEDEVILGESILQGKLEFSPFTDNKIPYLIDGKLKWDDGISSKTKFNVHEEIIIVDMIVKTTLNDNEFDDGNGTAYFALTNNRGITYKYVFEEELIINRIGTDDADDLKIKILGIKYEITDMDSDSISVLNSDRHMVTKGDSFIVDGVTLTINEIYNDYVEINGELIEEDDTERVNGIKIKIESVAYSSLANYPSKAVLNVAKGVNEDLDITYEDGDEYIGEDEDDPVWIWTIENPGLANGWIGVQYDHKDVSSDEDENVVYVGGSYILPENFAEVKFVKTTNVNYDKYEISFVEQDFWGDGSDSEDTGSSSDKIADREDSQSVLIEGPNEDSFIVEGNGKETNELYLYYDYSEGNFGAIEIYYKDIMEDVSDNARERYVTEYPLIEDPLTGKGILDFTTIAQINSDDTVKDLKVSVTNGVATLSIDGIEINGIEIKLGGIALSNTDGTFEWLGSRDEDADSDEVKVNGKSIGTEDNDVMDYYGIIIKSPENNGDDNEVVLMIPSEQVYATISIAGMEVDTTVKTDSNETVADTTIPTLTLNDIVFKDNDAALSEHNLIIVGGSCINSVAAKLLGSDTPLCEGDFTDASGVGEGQYMIKTFTSPYNEDKIAILVAGYSAADTTRGVAALLVEGFTLPAVGEHFIV